MMEGSCDAVCGVGRASVGGGCGGYSGKVEEEVLHGMATVQHLY